MNIRTILHIGQHKTGTTSIQHYLQTHRRTLIDAGLYVPDSLLGFDNPSHFLLNVYALAEHRESTAKIQLRETVDARFYDTFEERLKADIAHHYRAAAEQGCSDVLWTNEGLYLLNSESEYWRLRNLFDDVSEHLTCVCCFRDRESFRRSYMQQLQGQGLSLSTDPDSYRYLEEDSWLLNYRRKQALLESVFDEVVIIDYDPVDMVRTFMAGIGYPAEGDTTGVRLNTTPPDRGP